ncbi:hypothetical protein WJX72_003484 [[Myrmecia] bisecta]|uniref:BSD domain-containing protein n=1 Tax=[Myrmecia] bisecta TaxID=41462 RepID=A0AAW1PSK2_9CHLO
MAFWTTASVYQWLTDHVSELNRAIVLEPVHTEAATTDPPRERLPWQAETPEQQPYESLFREQILTLAQRPQEFLSPASEAQQVDIQAAISGVAGAVLEVDAELRQLRFRLVPKHITEEQFWGRYFAAVARIKQQIMATETADDQDMVHVPMSPECSMRGDGEDDSVSLHGRWLHRDCDAGQAASKTSEMTDLVLSGHSGVEGAEGSFTSKRQLQPREQPQPALQRAALGDSGLDRPLMRLRLPGLATSQASSLTDAMVMSPTSEADTQSSRMQRDVLAAPASSASQWPGAAVASRPAATPATALPSPASNEPPTPSAKQPHEWEAHKRGSVSQAQSRPASSGSSLHAARLRRLADAFKAAQRAARIVDLQDHGTRERATAAVSPVKRAQRVAVWALFNPMADSPQALTDTGCDGAKMQIGGVLSGGLLQRAASLTADLGSISDMATLWIEIQQELRSHWNSARLLPCVLLDANVQADIALLQQQLQHLNCCIAQRRRQDHMRRKYLQAESSSSEDRPGAEGPVEGLFLQATGLPMYAPMLQDAAPASLAAEEGTWMLKMACQQLASDMAAFKAANPGCVLADFVRWTAGDRVSAGNRPEPALTVPNGSTYQGELWHKTDALPACLQIPLFDAVEQGEAVLQAIAGTTPAALFEQLFFAVTGLCLETAASSEILADNPTLQAAVAEVRSFAVATCRSPFSTAQADRVCQVFAHLEDMFRSSAAQATLGHDLDRRSSQRQPMPVPGRQTADAAASKDTFSEDLGDADILDLDDWMML